MGRGQSESYSPELRTRIQECIRLFSEDVEVVTAGQVRDILRAADERGMAEICARFMLDNNPDLYISVHNALQELWLRRFHLKHRQSLESEDPSTDAPG